MKFLSVFFVAFLAVTCFSQDDINYEDYEVELLYMLNVASEGGYYDFCQKLSTNYMRFYLPLLKRIFPHIRVGIAAWGDAVDMKRDDCYQEFQPLSANMTEVTKAFENISIQMGNISPENALRGMSKGITSPTMKWTKGNMSDDGLRKVVKVLLMMTDDYNVEGAPEVDSGMCGQALSPQKFGDYLRDHGITFVGLVVGNSDLQAHWRSLWRQMDLSSGYCRQLHLYPDEFYEHVYAAINDSINQRSAETSTTTTEPESTTTTTTTESTPTTTEPESSTTEPETTTTTTTTEGSASPAGGLSIITKVVIGVASALAAIGTAVAITVYSRARARRTGEELAEGGVRSDEPVNRDQAAGTNENYV